MRIVSGVVVASALALVLSATASAFTWTEPQTLSGTLGSYVDDPAIAEGPDGTVVAAWEQYNASLGKYFVMAAIRKPSGATSVSRMGLSYGAYAQPSVAAGGDGTFAVAWEYPPANHPNLDSVEVRVWRPGASSFGAGQILTGTNVSASHGTGDFPEVAVDGAGTVYAVWETYNTVNGGTYYWVQEAYLKKTASAWNGPYRLSGSTVSAHAARISAAGNGYAAVTWAQAVQGGTAIIGDFSRPGSNFSSGPQEAESSTSEVNPPNVGESSSGKTAVVWEQAVTNSYHQIASRVVTGTVFHLGTPPQYLSAANSVSDYQNAAMGSNGTAVATWYHLLPAGYYVVQASVLSLGTPGTWTNLSTLTPSGYKVVLGSTPAAAADNERAIVAWNQQQTAGNAYNLEAAVRPIGQTVWTKWANAGLASVVVAATPADPLVSNADNVLGALLIQPAGGGMDLSILKP
jgi:hypothetical protein